MIRSLTLTFLFATVCCAPAYAATFTPGDVFWGDGGNGIREFYNVSAGGDFSAVSPLAVLPDRTPGQIAWSSDLATAYVTLFNSGSVVAVSSTGTVSTYATGLSGPTGLINTSSGRLLVAEFSAGRISDITSGIAVPYATGLSGPRNMFELSSGEILISEQSSGEVTDISSGGNLSAAMPFAFGLGFNADIVQDSLGRIFVSQFNSNQVMEITAGGNFAGASPFATGRRFIGLAIDGRGRLLASELTGSNVLDISAGGDFTAAPGFAFNLFSGESALDTVPITIPEPAAVILALQGIWMLSRRRH